MRKYFNTREKAMKHLEWRRAKAIERIEKRGDKILRDDSCVFQQPIWKAGKNVKVGELEMTTRELSSTLKWFVMLGIYTEQQLADLSKLTVDPETLLINTIETNLNS